MASNVALTISEYLQNARAAESATIDAVHKASQVGILTWNRYQRPFIAGPNSILLGAIYIFDDAIISVYGFRLRLLALTPLLEAWTFHPLSVNAMATRLGDFVGYCTHYYNFNTLHFDRDNFILFVQVVD